MKIRTDFVTNSSSSSFVLTLRFELINGEEINWEGKSDCGEGAFDYISLSARKSPKELGTCKTIDELIAMLKDSITQGDEEFGEELVPVLTDNSKIIKSLKKLDSVSDIKIITVEGYEDSCHNLEDGPNALDDIVTYNLLTKKETAVWIGTGDIDCEGNGGQLSFDHRGKHRRTPEGYFDEKRASYKFICDDDDDDFDDDFFDDFDEEYETCEDMVFVITGRVEVFENREEFAEYVEENGGTVSGSVTKNTDILVNNDVDSTSSKNAKAKELGIPIISEYEFIERFCDEEMRELAKEKKPKCEKKRETPQSKAVAMPKTTAQPKAEAPVEEKVTDIDNGQESCEGKNFVITGKVNTFANRDAFTAYVVSKGGKVAGSVTKTTDFLVNNDIESGSSKNKKAKELGIAIITEDEFIKRFGGPQA